MHILKNCLLGWVSDCYTFDLAMISFPFITLSIWYIHVWYCCKYQIRITSVLLRDITVYIMLPVYKLEA